MPASARAFMFAALGLLALAVVLPHSASAQADLSVTVVNQTCNPCLPGQRVTIFTTVTNAGPDPDPSVKLQSYTPVFGTTPVEDSGQVSQGTLTGPFFDTTGMVYWWDDQVGAVNAGSGATLGYAVVLDMAAPANPVFRINAPPSIAGLIDFQLGLFGQSEDQWNVTADVAVVDDGSALPHQGCNALIGFPSGRIAAIERGSCNFDLKCMNAQSVGATGVIMMNNNADQDIHSFRMSGTDFGDLVTIPVFMISRQNGDILEEHILNLGETVNATVGLEHPDVASWDMVATSYTYQTTNDPDCPDTYGCNTATVDTPVPLSIFADGFETGDTSNWSVTVP